MQVHRHIDGRLQPEHHSNTGYGEALKGFRRLTVAAVVLFALSGLASCALAGGDVRHAEELQRRALATAEGAHADWAAAHARIGLGRVLAAAGDTEAAAKLYGDVLVWSKIPRLHGPRESLFLDLAGDPGAAAQGGLEDLGWPVDTPAPLTRTETAVTSS